MWTGIDYLGESRWPAKSSSAGVLDTAGFKKDGFYFYQSQWTDKPVLQVFPHWNWKGKEGQIIPVICFTNCDTVELFLNGKSFGVKGYVFPYPGVESRKGEWYYPPRARVPRTTGDLHLLWDVPYAPGVLKAVGARDGNVISTVEIVTTGAPASIGLSVDRDAIAADGRDVAHFAVEILDSGGHRVPTADNEVAFEIQGEGKIIGVDNGNPESHESYQADHRKAFNGLCLAIVRASGKPGKIRLIARADGLKEASIEIEVKSSSIAIPALP
jgi:beta-galactosidase